MKLQVPYFKQETAYWCAPACMQMVFDYFGKKAEQKEFAKKLAPSTKTGVPNIALAEFAQGKGFYCYSRDNSTLSEIKNFLMLGLPVIVNFVEPAQNAGHFGVVIGLSSKYVFLHDPENGESFQFPRSEFLKRWYGPYHGHKRWILVLSKKAFIKDET